MENILVVDDDITIGNMLEEALTKEGYAVSRAYSGTEALYVLEERKPDLVLLDRMLPGLNGEEVLPKIGRIPVIVVSAKADVQGKVDLLLSGAVDYVTKPFELCELLARVKAHLRSAPDVQRDTLRFGNLSLDLEAHTFTAGGAAVHLTRTEYAILKLLLQNPGQVLPKSLLLERISQDTPDCTESSLKMHVSNLRRKLKESGGGDCIEAVWGIGFRLRA